jgi:peptidoglycan/LPS O-acetylase OafA/YrhL
MDNLVIALACIASVGAVAVAMNMRRVPLPPEIVLAIGGLTYPLYLLHQHVGFMLINRFEHAAPPLLLIASVATVITIASYVTWRFVEKPAQRRLKRLLSNAATYFGNRFATVPDLPPALAQWGRPSEKKAHAIKAPRMGAATMRLSATFIGLRLRLIEQERPAVGRDLGRRSIPPYELP